MLGEGKTLKLSARLCSGGSQPESSERGLVHGLPRHGEARGERRGGGGGVLH